MVGALMFLAAPKKFSSGRAPRSYLIIRFASSGLAGRRSITTSQALTQPAKSLSRSDVWQVMHFARAPAAPWTERNDIEDVARNEWVRAYPRASHARYRHAVEMRNYPDMAAVLWDDETGLTTLWQAHTQVRCRSAKDVHIRYGQ